MLLFSDLLAHPTLPDAAHPALHAVLDGARSAPGAERVAAVRALASSPSASADLRARYSRERRATVRAAAAEALTDPTRLSELADDPSAAVRRAVARNRSTPPAALATLCRSGGDIAAATLRNPSTPAGPVEQLLASLSDTDLLELWTVKHRLDRGVLYEQMTCHDAAVPRLAVLSDPAARRAALARPDVLTHFPAIVERLTADRSGVVRTAALCEPAFGLPPSTGTTGADVKQRQLHAWLDGRRLDEAVVDSLNDAAALRSFGLDPVDRALVAAAVKPGRCGLRELQALVDREYARDGQHAWTLPSLLAACVEAALQSEPDADASVRDALQLVGTDRLRALRRAAPSLRWVWHPAVQTLVEQLGDDEAAWRTACSMISSWQGEPDALADAVLALTS